MRIGDTDFSDTLRHIRANAQNNLARVREYMTSHLGCMPKEIAHDLDLSHDQARRAVRKIRAEWKNAGSCRL